VSDYKKKLIEVSLPLEAINRESAREKSIRHGHPSTLHLWWARRPLAACRAVLFAQLVDDPSAHPDQFPTEEDQAQERQRLFNIIERLVIWENINDEALLKEAHEEILKSTGGNPPAILDPFAGGGSIPLEAQRLGLRAYASDLNPVAVLINKALIEIPPKWAGQPPVFPGAAEQRFDWPNATGLAEDVRRYGQWMRDEAEKRIGHLYPKAKLPDGTEANVIAWIWARTITCPNPACSVRMPLVRSWWLGKRRGNEAYVVPGIVLDADGKRVVEYTVGSDLSFAPAKEDDGTLSRTGATCISCGTVVRREHIRGSGVSGDMSAELMAVVAEGERRRQYLAPSLEHWNAAQVWVPDDVPDAELSTHPQYMGTPRYGLTHQSDLFTHRQQVALTTLSDLVGEARDRCERDSIAGGLINSKTSLEEGGDGAAAYADSVAVYLALGVGRQADRASSLNGWDSSADKLRNVFARQALPMTWDFAESNPLGDSTGSFRSVFSTIPEALESLRGKTPGYVEQQDAASRNYENLLVATDPPYYDNVPYADLSDFFYGWQRKAIGHILPQLFGTVQTPKVDELVADQVRLSGKREASDFFEDGFRRVFENIQRYTPSDYPITVFYAFKQSEADASGTTSTGWQTLLEGMLRAGWEVTATWPMRTELRNRMRGLGSNALASSIVLALRPRHGAAEAVSRRGFMTQLRLELPEALKVLQQGSLAPVDLAQAAIGPGMQVFSHHSRVVEADGSDMSVRTALAVINQVLDEVLAEQEGDFDAETRFCVKWFSQFGWNEASSGEADILTRAVDTSVARLERGGVFRASAGKARLLEPGEMSSDWDPALDKDISVWETAVRIAHALQTHGIQRACEWMTSASSRVDMDTVKELCYLLYAICEKRGWSDSALLFNGLGTSWSDLVSAAQAPRISEGLQEKLILDGENGED